MAATGQRTAHGSRREPADSVRDQPLERGGALGRTEPLSTQNNVANLIVLAGAVVLPVLMLVMTAPGAQGAGETTPRGEPTIEGGITYGTR